MKLSDLYGRLSEEQRNALADKANVSPGYLRQLATGWVRKSRENRRVTPSLDLMVRLAAADKRLTLAHMVKEFAEAKEAA